VIRFILYLVIAIALAYCGATVPLGSRTFFGHVKAIWATPEAQDMKKGVEEGTKPMVEKVKRGVEAGYREATRDESPAARDLREKAERADERAEVDPGDVYVAPPDAGVRSLKTEKKKGKSE
jgi:hypothetical protein